MPINQVCSVCKTEKPVEEFHFRDKVKGLRQPRCKACVHVYMKDRYWNMRDEDLATSKAYREKPGKKVQIRAKFQAWYAKPENKARCRLQVTNWNIDNRERHLEILSAANHKRRARMYETESTLTHQEWKDRLEEFNNHCAYCLKPFDKLEMEHMQPISKGGTHTIENVISACRSCNAMKGDRTLLEFVSLSLS